MSQYTTWPSCTHWRSARSSHLSSGLWKLIWMLIPYRTRSSTSSFTAHSQDSCSCQNISRLTTPTELKCSALFYRTAHCLELWCSTQSQSAEPLLQSKQLPQSYVSLALCKKSCQGWSGMTSRSIQATMMWGLTPSKDKSHVLAVLYSSKSFAWPRYSGFPWRTIPKWGHSGSYASLDNKIDLSTFNSCQWESGMNLILVMNPKFGKIGDTRMSME